MSTRSYICMKTNKGYQGIYCHYDGYFSGLGVELYKYFYYQNKVNELFTGKQIRSVSGTEIDFFNDTENEILTFKNLQELKADLVSDGCIEWIYLWNGKEWTTYDYNKKRFLKLANLNLGYENR